MRSHSRAPRRPGGTVLAVIVLGLALIAPLIPQQVAGAAVIEVQNTNDSGEGSFRQAILDAADGNTIRFADHVIGTIVVMGPLTIAKDLTIEGPGATVLTISPVNHAHVIQIQGVTIAISGLTFSRSVNFGGGISNEGGTLSITRSTITRGALGNTRGGGIYNSGTLTVTNSTIFGNHSGSDHGGGIYNSGTATITSSTISANRAGIEGGGIYNSGTLTITNSTISGNSADDSWGGGIYNGGTLTLTNSTISGNTASRGGGIASVNGSFAITGSTIAGNTSETQGSGIFTSSSEPSFLASTILANDGSPNCIGSIMSEGYNLSSDDSCFDTDGTDLLDTNPQIGDLADNGGPTFTHALLNSSLAIDHIPAVDCSHEIDQRGAVRPQGDGCDIGAYEVGDQFVGPPALTLPEPQPVEATGPDGSVVTFIVSAVDWNNVPLDVTCDYESGDLFPIGLTEVECSATDTFDRTTEGAFSIIVLGEDALLAALTGEVRSGEIPAFLKPRLLVFLNTADLALDRGQTSAACHTLQAFSQQVSALSPRYIAQGLADQLSSDALYIRTVIGC